MVSKIINVPNTKHFNRWEGFYRAGNQYALRERLTPEANNKRQQALFRAWTTKARWANGERFVAKDKIRRQQKRQRIRLYSTIAKEAREIQDKARRAAEKVMDRMVEIAAKSFNETAAIAAANLVLDRAYGKANQTNINASVDLNGKPNEVTGKELDKRIGEVIKRVEGITGRAPKAPPSQDKPADVRQFDRDPDSPTQH